MTKYWCFTISLQSFEHIVIYQDELQVEHKEDCCSNQVDQSLVLAQKFESIIFFRQILPNTSDVIRVEKHSCAGLLDHDLIL